MKLEKLASRLDSLRKSQETIIHLLYSGRRIAEYLPVKPRQSVLVLHDLHIGYADIGVLERLIESRRGQKKFDLAVVSEMLDFTSFTPFLRERGGNFGQELACGVEVLHLLLDCVSREVHILPSNHEKRAEKRIRDQMDRLPADAVNSVAEAMNQYIRMKTGVRGVIQHDGFYLRLGQDVWITHGDRYLLTPGAAGRDILKALGSLGTAIGFSYDCTRLLVHAHEHRFNVGVAEGAQILVWTMPASCFVPFYAVGEPPSRYSRYPLTLGWGEIYFDERARVDLQMSRLVFYGFARLPEEGKNE